MIFLQSLVFADAFVPFKTLRNNDAAQKKGGVSLDLGRGRRLAMFAIEEVDASVNIDPIDPPSAFRRVVVGEEFTEADALLPRPFSSVDIGHFLTVMQVRSRAAAGDGWRERGRGIDGEIGGLGRDE